MRDREPHACEQQTLRSEKLREQAVVDCLAVGRVADERVCRLPQVPADLMTPASDRLELDQRVTTRWIAIDPARELDGGATQIVGARGTCDIARRRGTLVRDWCERPVECSPLVRPAPHDGQVLLACTARAE